jgi:hypothetical protein
VTGNLSRKFFGIGSKGCFAAVISLGSNYSIFNDKESTKRISDEKPSIIRIKTETGEVEILVTV